MEKKNASTENKNFDTTQPTFTIKLIGDAQDLSDIVSDLKTEYLDTQSNQETETVKQENYESNFIPPKKKLKMTEEVLPQRVILVVPKNSPPQYPSNLKTTDQDGNNFIFTKSTNKSIKTYSKQNFLKDKNKKEKNELLQNSLSQNSPNNLKNKKSVDDVNNINLSVEKDENLSLLHQISIDENVAHEEVIKNDMWKLDSNQVDDSDFSNYEYPRKIPSPVETTSKVNGVDSNVTHMKQKKENFLSLSKPSIAKKTKDNGSAYSAQNLQVIAKQLQMQRDLIRKKLVAELSFSKSPSPNKELQSDATNTSNSSSDDSPSPIINTSGLPMNRRSKKQDAFLLNGLSPIQKLKTPIKIRKRSANYRRSTNHFSYKNKQLESSLSSANVAEYKTSTAEINSKASCSTPLSKQEKKSAIEHKTPTKNEEVMNEAESYGLSSYEDDQISIFKSLGLEKVKVEPVTPMESLPPLKPFTSMEPLTSLEPLTPLEPLPSLESLESFTPLESLTSLEQLTPLEPLESLASLDSSTPLKPLTPTKSQTPEKSLTLSESLTSEEPTVLMKPIKIVKTFSLKNGAHIKSGAQKLKPILKNETPKNTNISKLSPSSNQLRQCIKPKLFQQETVPINTVSAEKVQPSLEQSMNSLDSKSPPAIHLNTSNSSMKMADHNSLSHNESFNNLSNTSEQLNSSVEENRKNRELFSKDATSKSPQIKVNGLMLRAPDPNLLKNVALKEKIQEFCQSNKPSKTKASPLIVKSDQDNNTKIEPVSPTIVPEISESLVSTTTVESGQLDKKTKDCQLCDRLRHEVNGQWKLITQLKQSLDDFKNIDDDNLQKNNKYLIEDKEISVMLMKQLEETNKKIMEELRKEKIYNSKLRLSLTNKNNYINELEGKLKRVSKIFEETEENAIQLRKQLNLPEVTNLFSTQSDIISNFSSTKKNINNRT